MKKIRRRENVVTKLCLTVRKIIKMFYIAGSVMIYVGLQCPYLLYRAIAVSASRLLHWVSVGILI